MISTATSEQPAAVAITLHYIVTEKCTSGSGNKWARPWNEFTFCRLFKWSGLLFDPSRNRMLIETEIKIRRPCCKLNFASWLLLHEDNLNDYDVPVSIKSLGQINVSQLLSYLIKSYKIKFAAWQSSPAHCLLLLLIRLFSGPQTVHCWQSGTALPLRYNLVRPYLVLTQQHRIPDKNSSVLSMSVFVNHQFSLSFLSPLDSGAPFPQPTKYRIA